MKLRPTGTYLERGTFACTSLAALAKPGRFPQEPTWLQGLRV